MIRNEVTECIDFVGNKSLELLGAARAAESRADREKAVAQINGFLVGLRVAEKVLSASETLSYREFWDLAKELEEARGFLEVGAKYNI